MIKLSNCELKCVNGGVTGSEMVCAYCKYCEVRNDPILRDDDSKGTPKTERYYRCKLDTHRITNEETETCPKYERGNTIYAK